MWTARLNGYIKGLGVGTSGDDSLPSLKVSLIWEKDRRRKEY